MKFTQYISPWHEGRRTKTVVDRTNNSVWMVFQEAGGSSSSSQPQVVSPGALAGLESALAVSCERHDHN